MSMRGASLGLGGCGLALALFGCWMGNPAFDPERGTGDVAEESGELESSGEGESAESSSQTTTGDGDGDGDSSESSDGPVDTTDGDCLSGSSCGPCHVCDRSGECVPDVGAACEGPATKCSDYLYGAEQSICLRLSEVTLGGRCSEQGTCEPSPPSECPHESGVVHFACDPACVTNPDGCTPFAPAADVEMSAMCAVDGPGPDCTTICANGSGSAVQNYGCSIGECTYLGIQQQCDPYACNPETVSCYESCSDLSECAWLHVCLNSVCLLP